MHKSSNIRAERDGARAALTLLCTYSTGLERALAINLLERAVTTHLPPEAVFRHALSELRIADQAAGPLDDDAADTRMHFRSGR